MFPLLPLWGLRSLLQEKREEQLQHATKLRSKYTHISNGLLRTEDIVAQLYQNEVLTAKERDDIQQQLLTPIRANEQLLNILMTKDSRAYDCFVAALCNTDQNHIAEILKQEDKYIDTEHSLIIQRNYTTLIENLDVDSGFLLDRLHEAGLITVREMATITAKLTKHEKSQTLLALVNRFRLEKFNKFVQALEKSSQEHVVYILTDKECRKLESITSTTTAVETRYECENSASQEKPERNLELQDHSTHNLQESILHSTKQIKKHSSHVKRTPFLTLGSKFANLPDELQTELSVKVAAFRQMTVLPSQANVEICFRKLLKGFIQQKKEANREQTAFEDVHVMLRRINESAESFTHQSEDKYKAEIRTLSEELGWQRNNKRHLDETLNATVIIYDERQKFQKQKIEDLEKERAELQKSMEESKHCLEDLLKKLEHSQRESRDLRENRDKLRKYSSDFVKQLKEYQLETEALQKQKDELQESVNESKKQISDLIKNHEREIEDFDNIVDQLKQQQKESEDLREERNELQMSVDKSKQQIDDLFSQREQDRKETTELLGQKDKLLKQLVSLRRQSDEERKLMEDSRKTSEALLMNKDGKIAELEHKLEQDAKAWAEKEEHLMNRMQEQQTELSGTRERCANLEEKLERERTEVECLLGKTKYKKIIAELRYKSDPVLVQTIRTKASEEEHTSIQGLAILDRELFTLRALSSEVEIYDTIKLSFRRRWDLEELIDPLDIGSCNRNKCLYILDYKHVGQSTEILRVNPNGNLIKNWSIGDDDGDSLSVTDESNIILTVLLKNKVSEYSPDGQLIREINLSVAGIRYPNHAIKLNNGHFVVSHGRYSYQSDQHRVSIVDKNGNLKKSFGGKRGSAVGQMDDPIYLAVDGNGFVMVADQGNNRVLFLDSDLGFRREILSKEKHRLLCPRRILMNESNDRLFVAVNKWKGIDLPGDAQISIFLF